MFNIPKKYHIGSQTYSIDLPDIDKGNFLITGNNGAGKTTFLEVIMNLRNFKNNDVIFSYAPQQITYDLTIKKNIKYIKNVYGLNLSSSAIKKFLSETYLVRKQNVKIKKLSGGQQKLCNILFTLIKKADYYVIDEVASDLDEKNVQLVATLIKDLKDKKNAKFIISAHNSKIINLLSFKIASVRKGLIKWKQ